MNSGTDAPAGGRNTQTDTVLVLRRETSLGARIRTFNILIDGVRAGEIDDGQTVVIPLTTGTHRFRLKCDWCQSPDIDLVLREGSRVEYVCRTVFTSALDPVLRPRHYIDVVPEGTSLQPQRTAWQEMAVRSLGAIPGIVLILVLAVLHSGVVMAVGLGVAAILLSTFVPLSNRVRFGRGASPPG